MEKQRKNKQMFSGGGVLAIPYSGKRTGTGKKLLKYQIELMTKKS